MTSPSCSRGSSTSGRRSLGSDRIDQLRYSEDSWWRTDSPAVSVTDRRATITPIVRSTSPSQAGSTSTSTITPETTRPQVPPNPNVDLRPGDIINVGHVVSFADNGATCNLADVHEFKNAEGALIVKAIAKRRYMIVLKVDEEHIDCLPIYSHNKLGVKTLTPRAKWCHVPMQFNTRTGVDELVNETNWPPIRYRMFGSHQQMDGKSHIWLSARYAHRFGKAEKVEALGEVLPESFRKLKEICQEYREDE